MTNSNSTTEKREAQATMLGRILEGTIQNYLTSIDIEGEDAGYMKEVTLLNLLANTLIYRTVMERDLGKISGQDMLPRLSQRIAHVQNLITELVNFHIDKHIAAAKESRK